MATAGLLLQTVIHTTESTVSIRDTVVVASSGVTVVCTMVCSERTVVMDGGPSPGLTEPCTKESSGLVSAKAKVLTSSVTVGDTRVVGRMVVIMDMEYASGKMVDVTRGNGSTEWRTAKALKPLRMGLFDTMANGLKTNRAYRLNLDRRESVCFGRILSSVQSSFLVTWNCSFVFVRATNKTASFGVDGAKHLASCTVHVGRPRGSSTRVKSQLWR